MVDRPADILPMDPAKPLRLAVAKRADMALRRTPGLGVFIFVALIEHWWAQGRFVAVAIVALAGLAALINEFSPSK